MDKAKIRERRFEYEYEYVCTFPSFRAVSFLQNKINRRNIVAHMIEKLKTALEALWVRGIEINQNSTSYLIVAYIHMPVWVPT